MLTYFILQNKMDFMRKNNQLFSLLLLCFSTIGIAHPKPVITLSLGAENTSVGPTNTNVSYFAPPIPASTYQSVNSQDTQLLGGVFLGAEFNLAPRWDWQWGFSYFQNGALEAKGQVIQFGSPNLNYEYDIASRRILTEAKLLYTFHRIYHPYVNVGIGEAFNRAGGYNEYAIDGGAGVPMSQPFSSSATYNFTYMAGLGIDINATNYLRFGLGYRYADLGKVGLGTTPLQIDTSTIKNKNLTSNEFLLQITAIC